MATERDAVGDQHGARRATTSSTEACEKWFAALALPMGVNIGGAADGMYTPHQECISSNIVFPITEVYALTRYRDGRHLVRRQARNNDDQNSLHKRRKDINHASAHQIAPPDLHA